VKWSFKSLVGCQSPAAVVAAVMEMFDYLIFAVFVCIVIMVVCCIKQVCKCCPDPPPAPQSTIFVISQFRSSSQSVQLDDPPPAFPLDEPPPSYEEVVGQNCGHF
jgi:hypothetical protein